ncbi:MAG: hypothetical protein H7138_05610 [Myxococcales bacterium]|nr:hypothetical protein [Myxococcales bacterium]
MNAVDSDPFVTDRVEHGASRRLLERDPEQPGRVEAMDCGPAVRAVADVAGPAGVLRDVDRHRDEAMVAVVVD